MSKIYILTWILYIMWSENEEVFIDIDYIIIHCRGRRIHCSFWGEFAKTIEKYFAANDNSLPIILMFFIKQLILQFGKTRKYMSRYSQLHITIHVWTILFRYFFFLLTHSIHVHIAMGAANSFFGTKVILKGDLPEVEMYKKKSMVL